MRIWWPIPSLLISAAVVLAQTPGTPPAAPANADQMLDRVLAGWEKAMTDLRSFEADCDRVSLDKAFNTLDTFEGKALFLKGVGPNQPSRASLKLDKKNQPQVYEKYICTGTFLYQYSPANKVVMVHDMPKLNQVSDESFLGFLFGMKAVDAKQRYQMTWVPDTQHNNKFYHYLRVLPKDARDKADFTEARLTLSANTMLPRQIWYHQPNGNEITWNFKEVRPNVNIPLTAFQPDTPAGWRMERAPQRNAAAPAPQQRVIRNQNP